jgi:hypothetical protein
MRYQKDDSESAHVHEVPNIRDQLRHQGFCTVRIPCSDNEDRLSR